MSNFTPQKEFNLLDKQKQTRRVQRRRIIGLWLAALIVIFLVVLTLIVATSQPVTTSVARGLQVATNATTSTPPANPTTSYSQSSATTTAPISATTAPATPTITPVIASQQLLPPTIAAPLPNTNRLQVSPSPGLTQIVPPPTATTTPIALPRLAIFGAGTTRRGDLTTLRPEDSSNQFTAGQDVFAYVNFAEAIPNTDKLEIRLINNGVPKPPESYAVTRPTGFLIVPLGKLGAGNYKLEIRYNGNLQAKQPEFKVLPPPPRMFGVGDSVMLGGSPELRRIMPNFEIDAMVSRQVAAGIAVLRQRQSAGLLPNIVVVHLGTNGTFSAQQFDEIMQILANVPKVIFVNVSVPRGWQIGNNQVIAEGVKRYPNTVLADWSSASKGHYEYFAADGYHLTYAGARALAELINAQIS